MAEQLEIRIGVPSTSMRLRYWTIIATRSTGISMQSRSHGSAQLRNSQFLQVGEAVRASRRIDFTVKCWTSIYIYSFYKSIFTKFRIQSIIMHILFFLFKYHAFSPFWLIKIWILLSISNLLLIVKSLIQKRKKDYLLLITMGHVKQVCKFFENQLQISSRYRQFYSQ